MVNPLLEADILRRARALIDLPDHWTKNAAARTPRGVPTDVNSDLAYAFCAAGACAKVGGNYNATVAACKRLSHVLWLRGYRGGLSFYNDDGRTTHADILNLFDQGVEHALIEAEASKPVIEAPVVESVLEDA